jgi:hypothetical protein
MIRFYGRDNRAEGLIVEGQVKYMAMRSLFVITILEIEKKFMTQRKWEVFSLQR